jgi:hypothetical protein
MHIAEFNEFENGRLASTLSGVPGLVLNLVASVSMSTPDRTHPLREIDVAGIPNLLDHVGNCGVSAALVLAATAGGELVNRRIDEKYRASVIVGASLTGAAAATAAITAHETGVFFPTQTQVDKKQAGEPVSDTADIAVGVIESLIMAGTFCFVALRQLARKRKQQAVGDLQ